MKETLKTVALFDLSQTAAEPLLTQFEYPWQVLPHISAFILELGSKLPQSEYEQIAPTVWVHRTAHVYPSAYLNGPCIVMAETEIRHGAFIRGNALVGERCVVGNSTELKNVILFNDVQVPHYNYVGDSILGHLAHMGAGSITSNVKSDKTKVIIKSDQVSIETGLKKVGAMIGDRVEIGCNSVLNPGTIIGRQSSIYPLSLVRGVIPADSIYKTPCGELIRRQGDEANGYCE